MRVLLSKPVLAICLAASLTGIDAAAADVLRAGGTGSSIGLLSQAGAAFTAESGIKLEVIPSLGSTGALRALADGKLDLAASARPLNAQEKAAGLRQVAVLRTPFVLVTSKPNPGGLKASDLPRIFSEPKPVWADGSSMRLILRPRSEADTALLGAMYPGLDKAIEALRLRPEVPVAATDQDNTRLAERMPFSLTGTTLAQVETEKSDLHIVPLDGVAPTFANFENGSYPYAKRLYFVVSATGAPAALEFMKFLRSPRGLKVLREAATLPDAD
ncbi:MAG TPA: substrate-binding domain-containing protein [Pseudolabrys sp.]|nr:substrate-binding domain-containing protein [Pseudolabrys sp.]